MFNKSNSKEKSKILTNLAIDTVIADGITLKGDIIGKGAIRIDGKVEGNVELDKGVILGEKAEVVGTIKSSEVVIYGKLIGDLTCKELHIKSSGRIDGNILVQTFSVEMGGKYNGNLKMNSNEISLNEKVEKKSAAN